MLGGIRSGKSRWAESALADRTHRSAQPLYIATGAAPHDDDAAWALRVAAHRERRPAGWRTVETADVATHLRDEPNTPTLVDDLGNWLTRTLDRRGWGGEPVDAEIDDLVSAVEAFTAPLVLVSPEVGLTVVPSSAAGRRFADELGAVNQRLAASCEQVVLVVAGVPLTVKSAPEG